MLSRIKEFISYWWMRYLMVTELYIVEPWERVTMHVLFAFIFVLMWYFNSLVTLPAIKAVFNTITGVTAVKESGMADIVS